MKKNKKNQINKIIKERILNAVQVGLDPKDVDQIFVDARNDRIHINIWTIGTSSGPMGRIPYGNRYSRITPCPFETEDEDDEDEDSEK